MVTTLRLFPYGREDDMSQQGQILSYEAEKKALFLRQHLPMQGKISSLTPQFSSVYFLLLLSIYIYLFLWISSISAIHAAINPIIRHRSLTKP